MVADVVFLGLYAVSEHLYFLLFGYQLLHISSFLLG
jgi:hypothetical protein